MADLSPSWLQLVVVAVGLAQVQAIRATRCREMLVPWAATRRAPGEACDCPTMHT